MEETDDLLLFLSKSFLESLDCGDLDSSREPRLRTGDGETRRVRLSGDARVVLTGLGEGDREMPVDIVETEPDDADRLRFAVISCSKSSLNLSRFLPPSSSAFASISSARPFLYEGYGQLHQQTRRSILTFVRAAEVCH